MSDLSELDAVALIEAFRVGHATPVDAYECAAAVIARRESDLNAMTFISPVARAEAEASARRWRNGAPLGHLDGVPITVKDNLCVTGMPATFASPAYASYVPTVDELPVARVRRVGAVVLGKTNLPEFALEGYTDNALFGPTGNPHHPELTPGGSTGGGAASVAAFYAPIALGTDGGGSLRRPAAHCGLVGLKTSTGRIPRGGGLPQLLFDFEVAGGLTRTLRDTRLLYEVTAGPDPADWTSSRVADAPSPASPLRILAIARFADAPLDPEIAAAFEAFLGQLEGPGGTVSAGTMPAAIAAVADIWSEIGPLHLAWLFARDPAIAAAASPKYRALGKAGARLPATRVLDMLERIARLRQEMSALFARYDVIVTPAIAALAWPKRDTHPPEIDGIAVGPRGHAVYTGWVNAAGLPALALPVAPARDGRRIGVQLIGPFGAERMLLDLGAEIRTRQGLT